MTDIFKREQKLLQTPEIWCGILAKIAWGWKFLEGWEVALIKSKERFNIANCSRQLGKSHTAMLKAVHTAISNPNSLQLVVAEQRQSNEDLRRARDLCKAYDEYLGDVSDNKHGLALITDNKTSLELVNGSRIIALPGNEKIRGYANPLVVYIDEAARLSDEVFIALEPMITIGTGQLFLLSTPNGPTGFFYKEWNNPRYTLRLEVPWFESERLKDNAGFRKDIERARMLYGEAYVKQEFECCFLDTIGTLFPQRELEQSIDDETDVFPDIMDKVNKRLQEI